MHSPNEGAFFCVLCVQFCGKSWLFWAKIAHLQRGCQLVCQNSVFWHTCCVFCVFFYKKIGVKVVQKCSQNMFVITQNQKENGRKSMCKKRCKFARYSHLEIQQKSVQIGVYQQCKTSKKCKKKSREISRLSFCCVDNYSASGWPWSWIFIASQSAFACSTACA